MLLKKRTLFSKIPAVSAHESKSSTAVPNFGRGFKSDQWLSRSRFLNERSPSLKSLGKLGRHFWAFAKPPLNPPAANEVAAGRSKLQVKTQSFLNSSFHYILYPEFRLKLKITYYILRICRSNAESTKIGHNLRK